MGLLLRDSLYEETTALCAYSVNRRSYVYVRFSSFTCTCTFDYFLLLPVRVCSIIFFFYLYLQASCGEAAEIQDGAAPVGHTVPGNIGRRGRGINSHQILSASDGQ